MDIEKNLDELKRRTALINGVQIDFRGIEGLSPTVLNKPATMTPEYQKACESFNVICDRMLKSFAELKDIISINLQ